MRQTAAIMAALAPALASMGAQPVVVGQAAPELSLAALLQAPEGAVANWESLRGTVVVLEFWATWCGPCVAALPHLNELAERFANRPVRFIAVTDEDREKIDRFLRKRAIKGWIGLDRGGATFQAYGIGWRPRTVIIDGQGRVARALQPTELTADLLEAVLAGTAVAGDAAAAAAAPPAGPAPGAPESTKHTPHVTIEIAPTDEIYGGWMIDSRSCQASAILLKEALAMIYGLPSPARVVSERPIPQQYYNIKASVPTSQQDRFRPLLQQAMETALGYRGRLEEREVEAVVLSAPRGFGPDLRASEKTDEGSHASTDKGIILGSNLGLSNLMAELERAGGKPLIDQTGLSGKFDWDVQYVDGDVASLVKAIREQLGLSVATERRAIQVLVLEWPGAE